jgi:hypothetical protein
MTKRTAGAVPERLHERLNRVRWRWLSAADNQWAWQDSPAITAIREMLIKLAALPRSENEDPPDYELHAETSGQLKVLQVLAATRSAIEMIERDREFLIMELRERDVSWGVIAMALGVRRQSAHQKYGDAVEDQYHHRGDRLDFEVQAARRIAQEIGGSRDGTWTDEERREALDFSDRWQRPWQKDEKATELARLHR